MLTLLAAVAAASQAPTKTTQIVEVDGAKYRVMVKGGEAEIARKSILTVRSPKLMERMREAAKVATGCEIEDAYWSETALKGRLVCP